MKKSITKIAVVHVVIIIVGVSASFVRANPMII